MCTLPAASTLRGVCAFPASHSGMPAPPPPPAPHTHTVHLHLDPLLIISGLVFCCVVVVLMLRSGSRQAAHSDLHQAYYWVGPLQAQPDSNLITQQLWCSRTGSAFYCLQRPTKTQSEPYQPHYVQPVRPQPKCDPELRPVQCC